MDGGGGANGMDANVTKNKNIGQCNGYFLFCRTSNGKTAKFGVFKQNFSY
jgi:hypothetical protein